jgi:BlaI family penicillinase repressor
LKESTVRTLLHRLEQKGYLQHTVEGRTYQYRASEPRQRVAAQAVRQIIDRLCGGSAEQLLVGLVDNRVVGRAELERAARRIAQKRAARGKEKR